MTQAPRPARLVNVANALTVARLLLVPVFVVFTLLSGMTSDGWRAAAAVTFAAASLTDLVDGWIARRFHMITNFGKVADPIADKFLTGSALVLFSAYGVLPWWATGLVLLREVGVTLLRFWVIRYGIIPASRGGKLKTALQILAITWYLLPLPPPWAAVGPVLMGLAVLVTVLTGVDYVVSAFRLRRRVPAAAPAGPAAAPPVAPPSAAPTGGAGPAPAGPAPASPAPASPAPAGPGPAGPAPASPAPASPAPASPGPAGPAAAVVLPPPGEALPASGTAATRAEP